MTCIDYARHILVLDLLDLSDVLFSFSTLDYVDVLLFIGCEIGFSQSCILFSCCLFYMYICRCGCMGT